jgi:hypothetical protein
MLLGRRKLEEPGDTDGDRPRRRDGSHRHRRARVRSSHRLLVPSYPTVVPHSYDYLCDVRTSAEGCECVLLADDAFPYTTFSQYLRGWGVMVFACVFSLSLFVHNLFVHKESRRWRCGRTWTRSPWTSRRTSPRRRSAASTRGGCTRAATTRTWPCCWGPHACSRYQIYTHGLPFDGVHVGYTPVMLHAFDDPSRAMCWEARGVNSRVVACVR